MKKSPLKRRTGLRKVSPKQAEEIDLRERLRQEIMSTLKVRDGHYLCQKCGKPADFRGLQLIHIVPLSLGGRTTKENCRLWCAPCHFGPDLGGHKHNEKLNSKLAWNRRNDAKV